MSIEARSAYNAIKAVAWENAKGALRAAVAAVGAQPSSTVEGSMEKLERFMDESEAFIKQVEDEGLQE